MMIQIKSIVINTIVVCMAVLCAQCASGSKMETMAPLQLLDAYFQKRVSGIEDGDSGFTVNLFVEKRADLILKEIYFKGKKIELKPQQNGSLYIGQYTNKKIVKKALIMSGDSKDEFKNEAPLIVEKIPFELEENECVIGYVRQGEKRYFKLGTLPEKEMEAYPSQKPQ